MRGKISLLSIMKLFMKLVSFLLDCITRDTAVGDIARRASILSSNVAFPNGILQKLHKRAETQLRCNGDLFVRKSIGHRRRTFQKYDNKFIHNADRNVWK